MKLPKLFLLALMLLSLTGCLNQSRPVSAQQVLSNLVEPPATYDIVTVAVPVFMKDMVEVSLHGTMQTLGYDHRRENKADIYIHANYEQVDFVAEAATERDAMAESTSMVEPKQFIARINIVMRDESGDLLWEGSVQRLHSVGPGDYMHRGHAANTIATALIELIAGDQQLTDDAS